MAFNLTLLNHTWNVVRVDTIDNDEETMGQCNYFDHVLKLRDDLEGDAVLDTLFHEVFHAYLYMLGRGLNDLTAEEACQFFSLAIMDLYRANPWLVGIEGDDDRLG